VALQAGNKTAVQVTNSVLSGTSASCMTSDAENAATLLVAQWSVLHDCGDMTTDNATVGAAVVQENPKLVSACAYSSAIPCPGVDLHLQADSPGIDVGKPNVNCIDEPAPNGCRLNTGAYAGTDSTTPKPGAEHCADACP